MKKENPYEKQVGGEHYKNMPMQPLYFARANDVKPEILKAIKYITRNKNRGEDNKKACHILDLYVENQKKFPKSFISWFFAECRIPMAVFINNNIGVISYSQLVALESLQDVMYCRDGKLQEHVKKCKEKINQIK